MKFTNSRRRARGAEAVDVEAAEEQPTARKVMLAALDAGLWMFEDRDLAHLDHLQRHSEVMSASEILAGPDGEPLEPGTGEELEDGFYIVHDEEDIVGYTEAGPFATKEEAQALEQRLWELPVPAPVFASPEDDAELLAEHAPEVLRQLEEAWEKGDYLPAAVAEWVVEQRRARSR